jgi:DNA-binding MarR family transcriptional regulator
MVQPPSVTKILSRLEQHDYVSRTPDPTDRRQVVLAATDAGRALLADDRRRKDRWVSQRLQTLDPSERAALLRWSIKHLSLTQEQRVRFADAITAARTEARERHPNIIRRFARALHGRDAPPVDPAYARQLNHAPGAMPQTSSEGGGSGGRIAVVRSTRNSARRSPATKSC